MPYQPFKILSFVPLGGGVYSLVWQSTVGGRYRVETSTDLVAWETIALPSQPAGFLAASDISAIEIAPPPGEKRFYRVVWF